MKINLFLHVLSYRFSILNWLALHIFLAHVLPDRHGS